MSTAPGPAPAVEERSAAPVGGSIFTVHATRAATATSMVNVPPFPDTMMLGGDNETSVTTNTPGSPAPLTTMAAPPTNAIADPSALIDGRPTASLSRVQSGLRL